MRLISRKRFSSAAPTARRVGKGASTVCIVVLAVVFLFFVASCDTGSSDDGGPSVGSVDTVTLPGAAVATDFSALPTSGYTMVSSQADALSLFFVAVELLMDHMDTQGADWEPSNPSSTFSMSPENLDTLTEPPSQVTVSAVLKNETIGNIDMPDAAMDVVVNLSFDSDNYPTRIGGDAEFSMEAVTTDAIVDPYFTTDQVSGHLIAAANAAADTRITGTPPTPPPRFQGLMWLTRYRYG